MEHWNKFIFLYFNQLPVNDFNDYIDLNKKENLKKIIIY